MTTDTKTACSSDSPGRLPEAGVAIGETRSVCPVCLAVVDASIVRRDGKVLLSKECPRHGRFEDTYFSDPVTYARFARFRDSGPGLANPMTAGARGCPLDCGICPGHRTQTLLANIDVTNRCNMHCPVCFANAEQSGYVYEPTKDEIREMMARLRAEKPVGCYAVQFAGGEPTVRDDLPELIEMAKQMGFIQVQIATNGVRMAQDREYCDRLKRTLVSTIYLQFDGVTPGPYRKARGFDALPLKLKALENMRSAQMNGIVLVPTLVRGVNDTQAFDIVEFAADNIDIVRGVNFQPVSFTGRIDRDELERQRITIPDLMEAVEKQSGGMIAKEDFFPVSCITGISDLMEAWMDEPMVTFSVHPHCGCATYVFKEKGELLPVTRFVDVEGLMSHLKKLGERYSRSAGTRLTRLIISERVIRALPRYVDASKAPEGVDMIGVMKSFVKGGVGKAIVGFHEKSLLIGAMHFMDPYNFDIERVQSCGIHYATPDGRVIPFCTYNMLYRQEIEKKFARPAPGTGR
jgi:uncharacterized radical SAM superfamily Fe-S cluster-containing enzyme